MFNSKTRQNIKPLIFVFAPIFIVLFFILCVSCRYYIFENYLNLIFSLFVYAFAGYFIKDHVWEAEMPGFSMWIFYFIFTGVFFSNLLEPNIFRFIYFIYKKSITIEYFNNFVYSIIAWSGWVVSFYYFSNIIYRKKLLKRKYLLPDFFIWIFTYLIYLNITISVIHRLFKKQF
ncbi:MAG: hypothetical protein OEZ13_03395 [Spirochaetia bacterium]|nr:hypothetical protein [Spirochaetia bacterium]